MILIDDAYLNDLKNTLEGSDQQASDRIIDDPTCLDQTIIGPATIDRADDESDKKLFEKIARLVNVRERSSSELRRRFAHEDEDEVTIENAIQRALDCGLLDDMRFAETLIRSRKRANKGKQGIVAELRRHNLVAEEVPGWPEQYFPSEEDEVDTALSLLKAKPPTSKNKRDGAYRKLISKGYDSSVAGRAARLWMESL